MLSSLPRVLGHNRIFVPDLEARRQLVHSDRGPDEACWHRVPAARDAHQGIIGDDALPDVRPLIGRTNPKRCESLPSEARERCLMRRAVLAQIGDGRRPLQEPRIQMRPREEAFPGERIPLHVLHTRLDLTLGLRPVRRARPRTEAVITSEVRIRRMPHEFLTRVLEDHRFRIVYYHAVGHSAKVLKCLLVTLKPLSEPLPLEGDRVTPTRIAERVHEDLRGHRTVLDPYACLAEVDLRLLTRGCLEAHGRVRWRG